LQCIVLTLSGKVFSPTQLGLASREMMSGPWNTQRKRFLLQKWTWVELRPRRGRNVLATPYHLRQHFHGSLFCDKAVRRGAARRMDGRRPSPSHGPIKTRLHRKRFPLFIREKSHMRIDHRKNFFIQNSSRNYSCVELVTFSAAEREIGNPPHTGAYGVAWTECPGVRESPGTVVHKSHDLCFHVFLLEAGIMNFVVHCTL